MMCLMNTLAASVSGFGVSSSKVLPTTPTGPLYQDQSGDYFFQATDNLDIGIVHLDTYVNLGI